MRFSVLAPLALAAAPAVVSAMGTSGFALGTKKADGSCKTQQDYELDLDSIASNTGAKLVRGYAAHDCDFAKNALPAAKSKGFKVMLGIWPDVPQSLEDDTNAIVEVADEFEDTIFAVTVGSETLYRGNFTGEELGDIITDVKSKLPQGIKVGTADSWNKFADGTADALISKADILLINAFAFWQGAEGANATWVYFDDMAQAISHIEEISGGVDKVPEIWGGETGWPTAVGTDYEKAKGGLENAEAFYHQGYCALLRYGYNAFYFEAFDEPWKPTSVGDNGKAIDETTWGVMDVNRKPKFDLACK